MKTGSVMERMYVIMKKINVSYWVLGQGMQHMVCEFRSGDDVWDVVLPQVRLDVESKGYTLQNVSQIQMGDVL